MMGKTHMMWGAFCAFVYIKYFQPFATDPMQNLIVFLFIIFGSILPDVDHPDSKLGRYVKPIGFLFEHRGFFHSIFAIIMWYFLFSLIFSKVYAVALIVGYVTHLFIDAFNRYGVSPFAPIFKLKIKGPIMTNGTTEKVIYWVLLILNVLFVADIALNADYLTNLFLFMKEKVINVWNFLF